MTTNEEQKTITLNTTTMTIADLLAMLDPDNPDEVNNAAVEALTTILDQAAYFYNDRDDFLNAPHAACWRALELASYLVSAENIDERVAKNLTDLMGCIAAFALA